MADSDLIPSGNKIGLLYHSYKRNFDLLAGFIRDISGQLNDFLKRKDSSAELDILDIVKGFKTSTKITLKPVSVKIAAIDKMFGILKRKRTELDKLLIKLSEFKKRMTFGFGIFGAWNVSQKFIPKTADPNQYRVLNTNIRNLNYAIDWAEKILMDLFNYVDQDFNLLTIIERMYVKTKIYESTEETSLEYRYLTEAYLYEEAEEEKEKKDKKEIKDPSKQIENEKNGVNRKRLYVSFIEFAKKENAKNLFSSIFDSNAFEHTFAFMPDDVRYFYRMANPVICVIGDLVFFSLNEIKRVNEKNNMFPKYIVFASTDNYQVVLNLTNKKIYKAVLEKNQLVLKDMLDKSFDLYLQNLIGTRDFLGGK